ncbi:MAG: hypothetical protein II174_08915, partial [Erysipelotrichaceae bacterium]|nr:hypothetical protein [Erysipelotrichaceae bacterium]
MKKIKFDLRFLYLFIPMLLLELIFHLVQFKSLEFFTVLRIFLFVSFLSFFISLITTRFSSRKVYFIVGLIVMIWFCAYSFVELIFKNFMGDFYSFGTVGDGALRIAQYAVIFLTAAKLPYYFCFLPLIVYILLHKYVHFNDKGPFQLPAIFCIVSFLLLIPTMDLGSGVNSILKTYDTFSNKTVIIDKYGIEHFFFRDLSALAYKAPDTIEIIEEEPVEEQTPVNQSVKREINDGEWKNIAKEEV